MDNSQGWTNTPPQELIKGTPEWLAKRDEILSAWESSKKALEVAKENEAELRKQFVKFAFDNAKLSGTERVALNNGYEAKAVKKLNYKFVANEGETVVDTLDHVLTRIEALNPEAKFIAERLVKWSADLSLTEYNKLGESDTGRQVKTMIDTVIETTEGMPTLEIIPPKAPKR